MAISTRLKFRLLANTDSDQPYTSMPTDDIQVAEGPVELAVTSSGERMVLVPVSADTEITPDRKSAGVHLEKLILMRVGTTRHFMAVRCKKPHLNAMFELVAEDLLQAFRAERDAPVAAARRVLALWRELLARDPKRYPSPATIRGLFGELWVLRELVRRSGPEAVEVWTGPLSTQQGVHDFSGAGNGLEVKALTQRTELAVGISSVEQLEVPEGGKLALSCLVLEELPGDGERIRDLFDDLKRLGVPAVPLVQRMHARQVDFDYLQAEDVSGFRILHHHTWWVDDDFPRLTSATLGAALPAEVTALTYRLDLTARIPDALDDEGWAGVLESVLP